MENGINHREKMELIFNWQKVNRVGKLLTISSETWQHCPSYLLSPIMGYRHIKDSSKFVLTTSARSRTDTHSTRCGINSTSNSKNRDLYGIFYWNAQNHRQGARRANRGSRTEPCLLIPSSGRQFQLFFSRPSVKCWSNTLGILLKFKLAWLPLLSDLPIKTHYH